VGYRDENGYPTGEWLTFKQAQALGANVKKAEKGTRVVFTKKLTIEEEEDTRDIFMLKTFYVFNAFQIVGLSEQPEDPKPEGAAAQFIAATLADIRHGGDKACYVPSKDFTNAAAVGFRKHRQLPLHPAPTKQGTGRGTKIASIVIFLDVLAISPTRPRNWWRSSQRRFCALTSASKGNCGTPDTSTIGSRS